MDDGNRMLRELFASKDAAHFGGTLQVANWTTQLSELTPNIYGRALYEAREIHIRSDLISDQKALLETVLHEMVHAHLFTQNDPSHARRNNAHGAAFLAELNRLAAAEEPLQDEIDLYVPVVDQNQVEIAAREYLARQSRNVHPSGKFDGGGRWYPVNQEFCGCCRSVRSPTRAYPYSLQLHCRTVLHVSHLFDVDTLLVRRELKRIEDLKQREKVAVAIAA